MRGIFLYQKKVLQFILAAGLFSNTEAGIQPEHIRHRPKIHDQLRGAIQIPDAQLPVLVFFTNKQEAVAIHPLDVLGGADIGNRLRASLNMSLCGDRSHPACEMTKCFEFCDQPANLRLEVS